MKYQINFASYDKRKEKRKQFLRIFWGALTLLLIVLFIFGIKTAGEITQETEKIIQSKGELAGRMEKQALERRKHFTDEELSAIENKLKFYKAAAGNKLFVTVFYNMLEENTPHFISLKTIDFDPARKNFVLTGESLSPEGVTAFIPNLQSSSIINKVEITRQTFRKIGEKKTLLSEFEIRGELI